MTLPPALHRVLDTARWAPSGDNTQPWRFEVRSEQHVVVHGFDTRTHCVYDLDGHPSQLALGTLLETLRLAALAEGWHTVCQRRSDAPQTQPTFDLQFSPGANADAASLAMHGAIRQRSVQRRAMPTTPLSTAQQHALQAAVGSGYTVQWLAAPAMRWRTALLLFRNARLRLVMPEAFEVHRSIIEWHASTSEDRVPDQALGVGEPTLAMMRFGMASWSRVHFLNRFAAGTWMPRLQMDLWPGWACAAHVVIRADVAPRTMDDYVAAGRAVQRFWLTATHLGLQQQPEMTPLIFSRYAREGRPFTATPGLHEAARALDQRLAALIGADHDRAIWMARVGGGPPALARSTRLPLERLMWSPGFDPQTGLR